MLIRQPAPLAGRANAGVSVKELVRLPRADARRSTRLVEYHQMSFNLLEARRAAPRQDRRRLADFFDVLGVKPMLGRTFRADDDSQGRAERC